MSTQRQGKNYVRSIKGGKTTTAIIRCRHRDMQKSVGRWGGYQMKKRMTKEEMIGKKDVRLLKVQSSEQRTKEEGNGEK